MKTVFFTPPENDVPAFQYQLIHAATALAPKIPNAFRLQPAISTANVRIRHGMCSHSCTGGPVPNAELVRT